MTKWIAALAAVSLAASPVAAQASRTPAPVEDSETLAGGAILWVFAAIMVIGAILIITQDDDDSDLPSSP